jgi:D-lactate dehydrogenase (cytochrome)
MAATEAVAVMMGSGLEPAALELLTPELIRLKNREKSLNLPETPSLFYEFHGISAATVKETAALAEELCRNCGATGFSFDAAKEDHRQLWRARHEAWENIRRAHPGKETLIVDAAVPISSYPQMVLLSHF